MNEAKRRFILGGIKIFDISQLILAFGWAAILVARGQRGVSLEQFFSLRVKLSNCIVFASILLLWNIIFSLCGLYKSKRLSTRRMEIIELLKAITLSTTLLALLAQLLRITMITPLFLVMFWFISSLLFVTSRLVLRPLLATL